MYPTWHKLHALVYVSAAQPSVEIYFTCRSRPVEGDDSPAIPLRLLYQARWIYDFTTDRILKNSTDQAVIPVNDPLEVDLDWLIRHGLAVGVSVTKI